MAEAAKLRYLCTIVRPAAKNIIALDHIILDMFADSMIWFVSDYERENRNYQSQIPLDEMKKTDQDQPDLNKPSKASCQDARSEIDKRIAQ